MIEKKENRTALLLRHQSKELEKLYLIENVGNAFLSRSIRSLDKLLASQSVVESKEKEESHHLTMWYLRNVCQL